MSDIFREIEEDVRRERIEKLWKQYGDYIIGGVAVVVLVIAGWQFWKYYHGREVARASDAYTAAASKAASGNPQDAALDFAKLAKDAPSGYSMLAKLQQANALLGTGNVGDAVAIYQQVEKDGSPSLMAVARLRHAWAVVDLAPKSEVEGILAPLTVTASDWKYSAREVLAYADYHAGDNKKAAAAFKGLADDKLAPENIRNRALAMETYISAGAGHDVGIVPPAAPVSPTVAGVPTPGGAPAAPAPTNGTPAP
ncbi:MAG TPA: tetratricopeptide repeat protein [Rhizomicrobium sp.]|nr:tetratricopeptide repeat protein [Rhizomicrobium sp.]